MMWATRSRPVSRAAASSVRIISRFSASDMKMSAPRAAAVRRGSAVVSPVMTSERPL